MNRFLIGVGLVLIGVATYYWVTVSRGEEVPAFLNYGLGITVCVFLTTLFYWLKDYFKKK